MGTIASKQQKELKQIKNNLLLKKSL